MSDLKIFSDSVQVNNKRVIVRLDLNVPIKNFEIEDDTRTVSYTHLRAHET